MTDDVFQMYLDELEAITPCDEEETGRLLNQLRSGDPFAKQRLSEGFLHKTLELTLPYKEKGIPHPDLIQEANIVLTCMIKEHMDAEEHFDADSFSSILSKRVDETLKEITAEHEELSKNSEEMVAKVNVLEIVAQRLAKESGRQATVAELAQTMKMSEEEINEIMKWTIDALGAGGE